MEVQTATVGAGVVPLFRHPSDGKIYAVLLRPGSHYTGPDSVANSDQPCYMIAGGFINLSHNNAVIDLNSRNTLRAEHPQEGAVRELKEELVDDHKNPIISPDPDRLLPVITKTLTFPSGERRVVIGHALMLLEAEVERLLLHLQRVDVDEAYRQACRAHTTNSETNLPEVCRLDVIPLDVVIAEDFRLLHPDQSSLFQMIWELIENKHFC